MAPPSSRACHAPMAPPPLHSLLRLSPLLLFLLLLAPLQPALGLDLSAGLQEDLGSLPEETCMSIQQLSDAVKLAAWTVPGINNADGTPRKAVIITTCNLGCLKTLFEPFMWAIENSRDGDFSSNVIVVGNGVAAYLYCDSLRHKHKHKCVLDRMCAPPNTGNVTAAAENFNFAAPLYFLALLQKVTWALEVLKMGVAVQWTDMDITYFQNPLKFMYQAAPDADLVIQTEYWDGGNVFVGNVCRFDGIDVGCLPGTKEHPSVHKPGLCCAMAINGGQWLFNPTPAGLLLLTTWQGQLFEDGVVNRKLWNGTTVLDQYLLGWLIFFGKNPEHGEYPKVLSARLYRWDAGARQYINHANVTRMTQAERIYRTSAFRTQSHCFGDCGWMGDNVGYSSNRDNGRLTCGMPRRYYERLVSFHQNCYSDIKAKRDNMLLYRNWSYSEELYERNKAQWGKGVFPEW